jgi:hypothetical protein
MNRVAPDGAWCLWQHMDATGVPAAASGEYVIVRCEDPDDPHFGGFTFGAWALLGTRRSISFSLMGRFLAGHGGDPALR